MRHHVPSGGAAAKHQDCRASCAWEETRQERHVVADVEGSCQDCRVSFVEEEKHQGRLAVSYEGAMHPANRDAAVGVLAKNLR